MKIAIDGYAGSGKSTISKKLSKQLNYTYIDTGAMYRMITLFFLKENLNVNQDLSLEDLNKIKLNIKDDKFYLNDKDVTEQIRSKEVTNNVSYVSALENVRNFLVNQQRKIAKDNNVILDGRDIGSVVFPDADVKFFLTATPEIRAKRRVEQNKKLGFNENYADVLESIKKRDYLDTTRAISPLIKVDDAIEIDSTNKTEKEVFENIKEIILKNIKQ